MKNLAFNSNKKCFSNFMTTQLNVNQQLLIKGGSSTDPEGEILIIGGS
ncbi:MAG: hypothetical protein ACPG49_07720 [Chitinophagales bacterium]